MDTANILVQVTENINKKEKFHFTCKKKLRNGQGIFCYRKMKKHSSNKFWGLFLKVIPAMIVICSFLSDKQVTEAVFQVQDELSYLRYGDAYIFNHTHCIVNSRGLPVKVRYGNCTLSASVAAPFQISRTQDDTSVILNIILEFPSCSYRVHKDRV